MNYYESQLNNVIQHEKNELGDNRPAIKIEARGNGQDTNWMDINAESAKFLVQWLTREFIKKDRD